MKVATVKYTGNMKMKTYRTSTGEKITFPGPRRPVEISDLETAREFLDEPAYEVEWTIRGFLLREFYDESREIETALQEMAYREKQKVAKKLGIKANQSEEELEEELLSEVDQFAKEMEVNN